MKTLAVALILAQENCFSLDLQQCTPQYCVQNKVENKE
jgi:hypothetical protein